MPRGSLLCAALCLALLAGAGHAAAPELLRLAVFNTGLSRDGPGLMLRDILRGAPEARAAARLVAAADADAIVLLRFDYDHDGVALAAFADLVRAAGGPDYGHRFARRPNAGLPSGVDLDGDGRRGGPRDAQGYGRFSGQGGIAVLSRHPIDATGATDYSALLWRDLPGATQPMVAGRPFPSPGAQAVQRLHAVAAWSVPLGLPDGPPLALLVFHATPPVFDGPEDLNGLRNADEIRFWQLLLDGALPWPAPERFVLLGNANLDPDRGAGRRAAIRALLADPRLQDPAPVAPGPAAAPLATGLWDTADGPGPLRVEYALPAAGLPVAASGLIDAATDPRLAPGFARDGLAPPLHRLVWVDLALAGAGAGQP